MAGRPQLARALDDLDTGDELVIAEWDRATRSMWDGLQIIKAVIDAGAAIKVLDRSYIDLTTPMGRGFMAMMSAMAEDERLRIIKRTHEGRQIALARGVRMGRKPKLTWLVRMYSLTEREVQMTLARIISIGIVAMFALAIGIASFDPVYAVGPCCTLRTGLGS